ncbi:MAG TPA: outer membrane lipoprotein carrier protein LolA [Geobacteraceae bacterium]|nr:outer membrane lipoprotein carrier protein LolA [Geobacteraceae bacterium]
MRRYAVLFLSIILVVITVPAFAEGGATLQELLAVLEKGYGSMEDLQADFTQRTYIGSLKREEKGGGELFLKKKGGGAMFRFNYTKPKQQIVSNGRTVWYYLPENRQVIQADAAKIFSGGNAMAMSYLTGLGNLSADFNVKMLSPEPDKKGNYQLELVPKKHNQSVAKLQLSVSGDALGKYRAGGNVPNFPVVASVLHDQMGNRTTIEYSRIKVNRGLGNDRFSFKVPAGVDVIKQ